jgi:kynureninase
MDPSLDYALSLDRADPLAAFRDRFSIPGQEIYMDGNSLGRLPLATADRLEQVVREEWGRDLIRSWGRGWFEAPLRVGEKIAGLVGASSGQVLACDSTSINLFKLSMAALALRPERTKIVSDRPNFPTDLYILQGCNHLLGGRHNLVTVESSGNEMALEQVLAAIDPQTALVSLSHVQFKSGYLYDAAAVTARAHAVGALVLWDLSHSAGAVPVDLDGWDADFAAGCTYKYLNGGPGAPAYLYVNRRWQEQAVSPIWGWWGQTAPFAFESEYRPAPGILRFLTGTPPVLSLLAVESGVELLLEAGIEPLRAKSLALTGYLIDLFDARLARLGFSLGTPRDPKIRGSHVSLRHPEGYRINRALIEEMGVIPDFREPDNIRFGLAPIYTTFREVWEAVERTGRVVEERRYERYPATRPAVT